MAPKEKVDFLKREEIVTMQKDIDAIRMGESDAARSKIAKAGVVKKKEQELEIKRRENQRKLEAERLRKIQEAKEEIEK